MKCDNCREQFEACAIEIVEDHVLCPDCIDESYVRCEACGDPYKLDDLYEMESGNYCDHCVTDSASKSDWDAFYGAQYDEVV